MFGNILLTFLYLSIGAFLAFAAWTGYLDAPLLLVWIGAAVLLLVGFWRLFHLSR